MSLLRILCYSFAYYPIMMVLLRSTKYLNMKEQSKRIPPQKASASYIMIQQSNKSKFLSRSYGATSIYLSITYYDGTPTEHEIHLIRNRLRYKNTRKWKIK